MLRVELTTQLLWLRTLVVLACLAAVPVMAGLSYASHAGHRNGRQTGLFGASPYSALNHAMASMAFIEPLLLPIMVALPAAAIGSSDRDGAPCATCTSPPSAEHAFWRPNSAPSPSSP
ncbi:hypothetical protein [Streptomyces sp. NPDC004296]|uniref:hypothetical protein n=1 Tax=Streptomyces sp. NPDC004296 TaxID=3364697 RepID=UPI0036760C5B